MHSGSERGVRVSVCVSLCDSVCVCESACVCVVGYAEHTHSVGNRARRMMRVCCHVEFSVPDLECFLGAGPLSVGRTTAIPLSSQVLLDPQLLTSETTLLNPDEVLSSLP